MAETTVTAGARFPEYRIEPLSTRHDRVGFSCGVAALDTYLHGQAGQDVRRRTNAVFVLTPDGQTVAGFYGLSAFAIRPAELPPGISKRLPKYPLIPATLLGRLAISTNHRARGLGKLLLVDALQRALQNSYSVASFAVVVDAKDEAVRSFYTQYDFISLPNTPNRLYLTMADIERHFAG